MVTAKIPVAKERTMETINQDSMEFTHKVEDGTVVFTLKGKLFSEADREKILQAIQSHLDKGHTQYLFDFSQLDYINSSGLGVFITLYTKIKNNNGNLIIKNPSKSVKSILSMMRLDQIFEIREE
jgi:anti-sigma B factor antagonist